jgi:uncharacterized protein (TIGR03437 family)
MRKITGIAIVIAAALASHAWGQTAAPSISNVVNSASYASLVDAGSLISIFGTKLATVTQSAPDDGSILPVNIGGTSATVNGIAVPLLYVSANQINAQIPWIFSGTALGPLILTAPGGSTSFALNSSYLAPGLFTADSSGCGQAAALNVRPDGSVSVNSPANSAAPGDYLALFGTGLGIVDAQLFNGAPDPAYRFNTGLGVDAGSAADAIYFSGTANVDGEATPSYAGLAPLLVGSGQVNVQIPAGTRNGCSVPIAVDASPFLSQLVTVSVNANRGACVDPVAGSYGQVSLTKTIASGTSSDGETDRISAQFPSAPGLVQPLVSAYPTGNDFGPASGPGLSSRSCGIPGYSRLSAGSMSVTFPGQNPVTVPAMSQADGVVYRATLPAGSIAPGQVQITSSSGASVQFQEAMPVGSPITIQTNLAPGTNFSAANPLTIRWSGGDANSVVRLSVVSNPELSLSYVSYTPATAGAVTLQNDCQVTGEPPAQTCSFPGVAPGPEEVVIEVLPASGLADSIAAQGLTQKIHFTWSYRYVFGGVTFSN